jgi:TolA-binding protein
MDRRLAGLLVVMLAVGLLGLWSLRGDPGEQRPQPIVDAAPSPEPALQPQVAPALAQSVRVPGPVPAHAPAPAPQEAADALAWQLVAEGDQAFEKGDLETATRVFQDIVDHHPDSASAPYAAYKLAWCRFNEGDRTEAIRSMELLVTWLETSEVAQGEALAREARKDLERFRTMDDEEP